MVQVHLMALTLLLKPTPNILLHTLLTHTNRDQPRQIKEVTDKLWLLKHSITCTLTRILLKSIL
jgi:hypothetical protein